MSAPYPPQPPQMPQGPQPPQLLPTQVAEGQAPGVRYRIQGELVPVLHVWLDGQVPVFFEHHVVLWKNPQLDGRRYSLRTVVDVRSNSPYSGLT